jgi:pimeloyl-ACP methyl ester carboxylesterase
MQNTRPAAASAGPQLTRRALLERGMALRLAGGVLALLVVTAAAAAAQGVVPPARPAAQGDSAGLVDIGGRRLYLECRGTGSPTVVLEDGAGLGADLRSVDLLEPAGSRPMVLPAVAGFTRVCAYDRPGVTLVHNPAVRPLAPADRPFPSRSDPAPMPRTAGDVAADLHALLGAAGVPGPYVLVGHSFGGLVGQLYARAYPDEVVGLVLVDAAHEETYPAWQALLGPTRWAEVMNLTQQAPAGLEDYPDFERVDIEGSVAEGRQARADQPLRPLPLAVLTHGRPFQELMPDWPGEAFERMWLGMQQDLAALVPNARFSIASQAGHNIHQDQPALVIEAVRQVVVGVRDRDTWHDLVSCCRP